jgi:hypothetical protein
VDDPRLNLVPDHVEKARFRDMDFRSEIMESGNRTPDSTGAW